MNTFLLFARLSLEHLEHLLLDPLLGIRVVLGRRRVEPASKCKATPTGTTVSDARPAATQTDTAKPYTRAEMSVKLSRYEYRSAHKDIAQTSAHPTATPQHTLVSSHASTRATHSCTAT